MRVKLILGVSAAVVAALLAGWAWGVWSGADTARALQASELRVELLAARAAVLDARVAIYSVNFGEASRHLENARGLLQRADERLRRQDRADDLTRIAAAQASIDEAQSLAGQLDQSANTRAGDAARVLADVLAAEPTR